MGGLGSGLLLTLHGDDPSHTASSEAFAFLSLGNQAAQVTMNTLKSPMDEVNEAVFGVQVSSEIEADSKV